MSATLAVQEGAVQAGAVQESCHNRLQPESGASAILDLDCVIQLPTPLELDHTVLNHAVNIRARLVGPNGAPVIMALGGISANRHACDFSGHNQEDAAFGWWRETVGPGLAVDTESYRVLSFDFFPGDEDLGASPVHVTTQDQARLAKIVCEYFGIERLHAFVGSSYGGMIALSFGALYPDCVEHLVVACSAHRPHAMGTAWRSIQRKIVRFGLETQQPDRALSLARELGMTTYRTPQEFSKRFSVLPPEEAPEQPFEVETYLETRGRAFIGKMSPERYITLSKSIDLHYVEPASIQVPVSLIGFRQDQIVPIDEIRYLHQQLPKPLNYFEFDSIYGHDAFLKETRILGDVLKTLLNP